MSEGNSDITHPRPTPGFPIKSGMTGRMVSGGTPKLDLGVNPYQPQTLPDAERGCHPWYRTHRVGSSRGDELPAYIKKWII